LSPACPLPSSKLFDVPRVLESETEIFRLCPQ
jgi:hypothetical protein